MKTKKKTRPRPRARIRPRKHRRKKSLAIVPVPQQPVMTREQSISVIPKIKQTIENLERMRRFVSQCLNIDLQKAEAAAKAAGTVLDEDTRKRLEIDWGTIPGVDKPFLMQPGAEKMMKWLQLRPKFITSTVEHPGGHLEVICRVILYSLVTGEEVFEGPDASCTTMETNYRYVWREADQPNQDEQDRLKLIGMGRNHQVWKRNKRVWVWQVRIENPNISNERNKVRQIGQKRGLVKCMRQQGAISEIFNADPSEWNISAEEEDELEAAQDYTPEGRRILIHGKSPSGKYVTPAARRAQAKANQEAVLNRKLSEREDHGHEPGSQRAQQAEAALKRVQAEDERLAKAKNVTPSSSKPEAKEERGRTTKTDGAKHQIPTGATPLTGTIHTIVHADTPGRHVPVIKIRLNQLWYTIWSRTIQQAFPKGRTNSMIGNVVECYIQLKPGAAIADIVGLHRIGDQFFAADGRTPIPREPGAEG